MNLRPPFAAIVALVVLAAAAGACRGSSSNDRTPTSSAGSPVASVTASGNVTPGGTASGAIRSVDLQNLAPVKTLLTDTGGRFAQSDVLYADLTGDGADEAVVPVSSGGTLGDVAFIVLTMSGADTKVVLREYPRDAHGLAVAVVDGKLIETQPVPGPDDPECCPGMLRKTTYAWNGAALAVESVKTEVNPEGGAKGTPSGPPVSP